MHSTFRLTLVLAALGFLVSPSVVAAQGQSAIAGVARTAPGGTTYAALWLPGAVTPIDLGAGPGIPMALSDGGTVVGHAPTGSGDRAFRWDAITGLQWLTAGPASQAWDVNTAGTIVGSASQQASYLAGDPA